MAVFFLILTEKLSWLNVATGLLIALAVYWLNKETVMPLKHFSFRTIHLWVYFVIVLVRDMIVSNLQVAAVVLSKDMAVMPVMSNFQSRLQDDFLLTVHANVITLTPGTMTVEIEGSHMVIHCLNDTYAEGLSGSTLEAILLKIEEVSHA